VSSGFALFETAVGLCGIGWGPRGLICTGLPERDAGAMRARLASRTGAQECEPNAEARAGIARICDLLDGRGEDFSAIRYDDRLISDFERAVYVQCRAIAPGQTKTYGEIAKALGDASAARAVGVALGRNPWPIVTPCHRVLAAGGAAGGFSAPGGLKTKFQLLEIERKAYGPRDLFS
jgi:methylated-DNA-[protein]-cysteine S-methyltransferase